MAAGAQRLEILQPARSGQSETHRTRSVPGHLNLSAFGQVIAHHVLTEILHGTTYSQTWFVESHHA